MKPLYDFNRSSDSHAQVKPVRKWLLFGFSLLLVEILIAAILLKLFLWVERDYCAPYFRASGHCYAEWFTVFESAFYVALVVLMSSAVILLWRQFLRR